MADIQLDVASANRFISSLSKSLQALCHGCMDFDAGIEIVGYINVNIDSGSKVDYVLNEKVLKSTTNSMTFVSNSFLAKKDQPKNCKDGSCSPIPELNYNQQRTQGNYSYPAAQLYRSSGIYSPHSQVVRGSQKRQWSGGDWRMSPRKYSRGGKSQYGVSYQQQSSPSQNEAYSSFPNQQVSNTSSAAMSSQNFPSSQQEYDNSVGTESDVNIKTEVEDTAGENAADGESIDQTNSANTDNVNIKADPDAVTNQGNSESNPAKTEPNISDSFLQQPTKTDEAVEDSSHVESNNDNSEKNYEDPSYSESYGEMGNAGEGGDHSNTGVDSQRLTGASANFEESGEMFSESYAGEGTSGGGQFEVIEIDDEDEDVAAMFDDSRSPSSMRGTKSSSLNLSNSSPKTFLPPPESGDCHFLFIEVENGAKIPYCYMFVNDQELVYCAECGRSYRSSSGVKAHFKIKHCGTFDYHCDICGKGFQQQSHLKCHMVLHSGEKQFGCGLCGSRYAHKTSLTAHMKLSHNGAVPDNCDKQLPAF